MRVVVTGTNRGIGLELVRQYLERGDLVDATTRAPSSALSDLGAAHGERLQIRELDVTDDAAVRAFAAALSGVPVDLLINNAGVLGKMRSLEQLDLADVSRTFEINALGPLRMTRALLPNLRAGQTKKIAHLTSTMASITEINSSMGGAYGYRMSKAALNMASRAMSLDLRAEGLISVLLNPGWVQTDMGGRHAPTPVEESARGLIRQIDRMTLEHSGRFLDFRGQEVPW